MPNSSLTPLYYTDAQLAQMLTPSLDTPSNLALPTNMSTIQQGMLAQNANDTAFPTTPAPMAEGGLARGGRPYHAAAHEQMYKNIIQHFAKGGLSNPEAEQLLQHSLVGNDSATIEDAVNNDPHIMNMFGVKPTAPTSRPVAQGTADTLAGYDTPQGKAYLADRAAMPKTPTHIHDILNPPVQRFAGGGQVSVLQKFSGGGPVDEEDEEGNALSEIGGNPANLGLNKMGPIRSSGELLVGDRPEGGGPVGAGGNTRSYYGANPTHPVKTASGIIRVPIQSWYDQPPNLRGIGLDESGALSSKNLSAANAQARRAAGGYNLTAPISEQEASAYDNISSALDRLTGPKSAMTKYNASGANTVYMHPDVVKYPSVGYNTSSGIVVPPPPLGPSAAAAVTGETPYLLQGWPDMAAARPYNYLSNIGSVQRGSGRQVMDQILQDTMEQDKDLYAQIEDPVLQKFYSLNYFVSDAPFRTSAPSSSPYHPTQMYRVTPKKYAAGGQVSVLNKFKAPLPAQKYVDTPHYRQTFKNPALTKVRTEMRVR